MQGGLQFVFRQQRQRLGTEEASQHQNGLGDGVGTQHQRLLDPCHRIGIGLGEGVGHLQQPMAIGIGLEYRDDLAVGGMAAHHGEIVLECIDIDAGRNCVHHGSGVCSMSSWLMVSIPIR